MIIRQRYAAPPADVWDAVTRPERLARWFPPVSGELREGGRYQIEGNASGTVQRCDPPTGFAASWEFGGQVSWIEVRLAGDQDGGTWLELEHIAAPDDAGHWASFGPGAMGVGWDLALHGLASHLRSSDVVRPEERPAGWPPRRAASSSR